MQLKKLIWAAVVLLLAAALASCNIGKAPAPTPDTNAIYTAAAQTTVALFSAQQTQTAQAVPPTPLASPTPLSTFTALPTFPIGTGSVPFGTPFTFGTPSGGVTPLPSPKPNGSTTSGFGVGCNDAVYVSETKPLDKTVLSRGESFTKGWMMQNTGTCTWDRGYSWVFVSGDRMDCENTVIGPDDKTTPPGHSNTFNAKNCFAPGKPGEYKGFWSMKSDTGTLFGFKPWVDIVVK